MFSLKKTVSYIGILLILSNVMAFPLYARDKHGTHNMFQEIVFLIDVSQSMNAVDPDFLISEYVEETISIMPELFRVGIVAYSTEVITVLPFDVQARERKAQLEQIGYAGYSNIGAGLAQAIELFSSDRQTGKRIILISDGELSMPKEDMTKQSLALFDEALEKVRTSGIALDILKIGQEISEEENILPKLDDFAAVRHDLQGADELAELSKGYLFQLADMVPISVGKLNGKKAQMSITLPDKYAEKVQICLLGKQLDAAVNVSSKAGETTVENGFGYTVVSLKKPADIEVSLAVSASEDMDVSAYLNAEYSFQIAAEAQYEAENQKAAIYLDILTPKGNSLLEGHLKETKDIKVYINDEDLPYRFAGGKMYIEYPVDPQRYPPGKTAVLEMRIILPETYGIYYGDTYTKLSVVIPTEEKTRPDWFLISVVGTLFAALAGLFLWSRCRRIDRPEKGKGGGNIRFSSNDESAAGALEPFGYDYCGKLNIYVLESGDGTEYPPASLNLFASCQRRTITLKWILDTCNLPLMVKDADKIIIKPGEKKALMIKNNSKATAIKGRDVLVRTVQYPIYFHEKITFIFEEKNKGNQTTELEIHYKDLKI